MDVQKTLAKFFKVVLALLAICILFSLNLALQFQLLKYPAVALPAGAIVIVLVYSAAFYSFHKTKTVISQTQIKSINAELAIALILAAGSGILTNFAPVDLFGVKFSWAVYTAAIAATAAIHAFVFPAQAIELGKIVST